MDQHPSHQELVLKKTGSYSGAGDNPSLAFEFGDVPTGREWLIERVHVYTLVGQTTIGAQFNGFFFVTRTRGNLFPVDDITRGFVQADASVLTTATSASASLTIAEKPLHITEGYHLLLVAQPGQAVGTADYFMLCRIDFWDVSARLNYKF